MSTFIDFCLKNDDFTKIMITLGIKTPMYKNLNLDMRKVAHVALELLTSDNDAIGNLFVCGGGKDGASCKGDRIRCYSEE